MPIMFGDQSVAAMKLGSQDVLAAYIGSDLVWSKTAIFETFDVADTSNLESLGFVHYGSSTYKIAVNGGVARVNMPDGISELGQFIDRVRFDDAVAPADDGYLQFRVDTSGSAPSPSVDHYITDVLGRGSNGDVTDGVGVRLENSAVGIVRRVSDVDTLMEPCGAFAPGDVLRLKMSGDLYTLTRNGAFAGEWNDTGETVTVGAGNRSLLMRSTGGRELFGSRRFSPAIDYVEYG